MVYYSDCVSDSRPLGMSSQGWLVYYAGGLDTCGANLTCYALPEPCSLKAAVRKTERPLSLPAIIDVGRRPALFANCG